MNVDLKSFIKKEITDVIQRIYRLKPSDMENNIQAIEQQLFSQYNLPANNIPLVFILASPRTGSTMLYQMLVKYFGVQFFSNYIEKHFVHYPFAGVVFEKGLRGFDKESMTLVNQFGETFGEHEPSEATGILQNWFNWEHPTEKKSNQIKKGRLDHMVKTLGGISAFSDNYIVIKNAWNCFRIQALKNAFPASRFIWLRRNIINSSYSTLLARKQQGNPNEIWNSASPSNFYEIKKLPYIEQVVQQQYWTNIAVNKGLNGFVPDSDFIEIWYEDIIFNPKDSLLKIAEWMCFEDYKELQSKLSSEPFNIKKNTNSIHDDEYKQILNYSEAYCSEMINS